MPLNPTTTYTDLRKPCYQLAFISLEPWDDVWRRNQFVCRALAQRGWRILFVEPPADWAAALRDGRRDHIHRPKPWSPEGLAGITVTRPIKLVPRSYRAGRAFNHLLLRRHIDKQCRKLGWGPAVLWINDQSAWRLAQDKRWDRVIYDVTDDWTEMGQSFTRELVKRDDRRLCALADHVVVCSQRLAELKREQTSSVSLVPNGVDVAHYRSVLDADGPAPDLARDWTRPVLGYTGTIHPDRMDVSLLKQIAAAWPGTVALIGPDHLGAHARELAAIDNLAITGPVPYREIPDWMRQIDVMIVPHLLSKFTESLNPIKLWEYLAAGKPIVSTPVAGFRDFPDHVRLATGAEAFLAACRAALDEDREAAERRQAAAAAHAWSSRVDDIERLLRGQDPITLDPPAAAPPRPAPAGAE